VPDRRKILFITPYPIGHAPSQRFRFEQYFEALQSNQIEFSTQSFLTISNWRIFYGKGKSFHKGAAVVRGFWRRVVGLFDAWNADFVFIHREASPIGPPVFEWIIARILRRSIIYDFDDAIWLTDNQEESALIRTIKWRGKVSTICKMASRISCGNKYLHAYATRFSGHAVLNPSTIDTTGLHNPDILTKTDKPKSEIVIGWTGSHSTIKYLNALEETLQWIEREHAHVRFMVIADKPPTLNLQRLTFIKWNQQNEVADLLKMDIGIMPLPDDDWSMGKCGFKILQYMALRIPSVSSPVGVNSEIVRSGENGFLAVSQTEWIDFLSKLINDPVLRLRMGQNGRETVEGRYSVTSNTPTFLSLFE